MNEKLIIKRILLIISIGILLYLLLTNMYYPINLTHIFNICFIICFISMLIIKNKIIYMITGVVYLLFACKNFFSNIDAIMLDKTVLEVVTTYVVSCILMGMVMIMTSLKRKKTVPIILLSILTIALNVISNILQARTYFGLIIREIPSTAAMLMPAIIAIIECKMGNHGDGSRG